jgi:hypothetical protein
VQPLRVDQEAIRRARNRQAEVIADAFVETQPRSPSQSGGQINSRLSDFVVVSHKCLN